MARYPTELIPDIAVGLSRNIPNGNVLRVRGREHRLGAPLTAEGAPPASRPPDALKSDVTALAGQPAERIELSVGDLARNDGDGDRPAGDRLALGEARDQRTGPPARSGGENKG